MAAKTCKCGSTLHISKFRVKGKMTNLCPTCRNRKRSLEYYHRQRRRDEKTRAELAVKKATAAQQEILGDDYTTGMFREIRRLRAQPARRVRLLEQKFAEGRQTARTMGWLEYQRKKVSYYEDVERIMRKDLEHDNLRPVDFYLANTYLLYKHGFNVRVIDANPEVTYE